MPARFRGAGVLAACGGGGGGSPVSPGVPASPAFTQQPPDPVKVFEGRTATLTVAASGVPAPTFQWQVTHDRGATWANVTTGDGGTTAAYITAATTLADDTSEFRAVASNSQGSATSDWTYLEVGQMPGTPVLAVSPGDTLVALEWTPVTGVSNYNLYWSNTPGVTSANGHLVAFPAPTLTSCTYTHSGLVNGTPCCYVMAAANIYGQEGTPSPEVQATPAAGATAPFTGAAAPVTDAAAWLSGTLNVPAGATVSTWFEWGTTTTYGSQSVPVDYLSSGEAALAGTITGLASSTSYQLSKAGGSPLALATNLGSGWGMAADGKSVYWVETGVSPSIREFKLAGDAIYFFGSGGLMSLPVAGGTPSVLAAGVSAPSQAPYLMGALVTGADESGFYWLAGTSEAGTSSFEPCRMPLGGGSATPYTCQVQASGAMVVDASRIYWSEWAGNAARIVCTPK